MRADLLFADTRPHRALAALVWLGAMMMMLVGLSVLSLERGLDPSGSDGQHSVLLLLPQDQPTADLIAELTALQGVVQATALTDTQQMRALSAVMGRDVDPTALALAGTIRVQARAPMGSGLEQDLVALVPGAQVIRTGGEAAALTTALWPLRLLLWGMIVGLLAFWVMATWLALRLVLTGERRLWETLLLVGATPARLRAIVITPFMVSSGAAIFLAVAFSFLLLILLRGALDQSAQTGLLLGWVAQLSTAAMLLLALLVVAAGLGTVWLTLRLSVRAHLRKQL